MATIAGRPLVLLDSVSYITEDERGAVVVTGSHGGSAAGRYARAHPPWLVIFNDAGIGKERAGVVALEDLAEIGMAAAAVSHQSARIGDAGDTWESGIISQVNSPAAALGLKQGARLQDALLAL